MSANLGSTGITHTVMKGPAVLSQNQPSKLLLAIDIKCYDLLRKYNHTTGWSK